MKKLITAFILISLLKGVVLYLIILSGNLMPSIPGFFRFVMFVLLLILIDLKVFSVISPGFEKRKWIKLCAFSLVTFVMVLFITGPLFVIQNYILNITTKGPNVPMPGLIGFLIFGFIVSAISSTIWIRKTKVDNLETKYW